MSHAGTILKDSFEFHHRFLLYISVKKKELSEAARDYLAEQTTLKLEYDLYYHIRTRLLEQMRRLDISPEPIL